MQMFQIRHPAGSKDTVIIPKILGISEEDSTETVEYAGEMHEKKNVTVILYMGHDLRQKVKSTDKVVAFEWVSSRSHAGFDRAEKEIPFEEFHDWLIEQLAEHRSFA
jgi:hypothetical protein